MPEPDRVVRAREHAGFWAVALAVLLIDQLTKLAVRHWLPVGSAVPVVPGVFDLTHAENTGAAFGILPNGAVLFLVVSVAACLFLALWGPRLSRGHGLLFWALSSQFGGAMGNLVDRVAQGRVTDFLDFHVWPVFNVADIALTAGAGLLVLHLILYERRHAAKEESTCDPS